MLNNRNCTTVIAHINLRSVSKEPHTQRIKSPPCSRLQKWDMKECSIVLSLLRHILCGMSSQSIQSTLASSSFLLPCSFIHHTRRGLEKDTLALLCLFRFITLYTQSNKNYFEKNNLVTDKLARSHGPSMHTARKLGFSITHGMLHFNWLALCRTHWFSLLGKSKSCLQVPMQL